MLVVSAVAFTGEPGKMSPANSNRDARPSRPQRARSIDGRIKGVRRQCLTRNALQRGAAGALGSGQPSGQ